MGCCRARAQRCGRSKRIPCWTTAEEDRTAGEVVARGPSGAIAVADIDRDRGAAVRGLLCRAAGWRKTPVRGDPHDDRRECQRFGIPRVAPGASVLET